MCPTRTPALPRHCSNLTTLQTDSNPTLSSFMFAAGVVGNLAALAILGVHRQDRRAKTSSFCILVTGLVVTDLAGTCVVSPVVFLAYSSNSTLVGLVGDRDWLCNFFAFSMMYFSLAAMFLLCAMAVERCLAISYPYYYSQHRVRRWVKLCLPLTYTFSGLFCALPFLKVGKFKQYCPGTWCFVQMDKDMVADYIDVAFSLSYATVMALLIAAIFLCNGLVIVSLCQMYRKQRHRRRGSLGPGQSRKKAWFSRGEEEVDYLVLLALMTVIFVICTLPLTIRAYIGGIDPDHSEAADMVAFRLSALNPIVDPWLFILFRHAVFRSLHRFFCYQLSWPCWFRTPKGTAALRIQDSLPCQAQSVC
ncbi:prostacyclin receptor [Erythrolamprus reginae]|uniref:prostacyclin receptor n=1 Tax=Erythrolamprus reginae TaxID=121349 RepID=UPI00396C7685